MVVRWSLFGESSVRLIIVLLGVGFPHLMVAGGLPSTDEGIYAYYAQIIHSSLTLGHGLPDTGPLVLYPILLSWVFELSANHIIVLRLIDMIVAIFAGWLLFRIVETESRSRVGASLISLIFLFTISQPIFIQSGFKNSIFAAYIPLFLAVRLAQRTSRVNDNTWYLIGALAAVSVLLRETFLPFIIVGAFSVFFTQGWKMFLRYSCGAAVTGFAIMLTILTARGGIQTLIDSYREAGIFYASVANQRAPLFIANGIYSVKSSLVSLGVGAVSIITIIVISFLRRSPEVLGRFTFWIVVTLVPLLEPISKIGFPYHFAVCLPGLAGISALAWRSAVMENPSKIKFKIATAAIATCTILLFPNFILLTNNWASSQANLASIASSKWPNEAINQSNYLLAAETIRRVSPPNGTLSISGFMFALYPLTGLLPPTYEIAHLNSTFLKLGSNKDEFTAFLKSCAPDVLMTTTRNDLPGSEAITKIVEESGLYQAVEIIPIAPEKNYGTFGGIIFKKLEHHHNSCETKLTQ